MSAPFLCFQKAFVFVGGGAADIADSRQFADVQLPFSSKFSQQINKTFLNVPDSPPVAGCQKLPFRDCSFRISEAMGIATLVALWYYNFRDTRMPTSKKAKDMVIKNEICN